MAPRYALSRWSVHTPPNSWVACNTSILNRICHGALAGVETSRRAARGLLHMNQASLAAAASVSRSVIVDFENGHRTPNRNNLAAIQRALEAAGVEFTNGGAPGVRLGKGE